MLWRLNHVVIVALISCCCSDTDEGSRRELRIFNGDQAAAGEFPFVVSD
jgi:secreted trypsin-like serine protease